MITRLVLLAVLAAATAACGATPRPRTAARPASDGNPLGPSYVLMPLPGEDDSLLGRVIPAAPEPGRSLEEVARANPCSEHLAEKRETPLASSFEYAEELEGSASAGAMLGTFGFSADARRATHFIYKIGTDRRVGVVDTADYAACCAEKGCGYGYVSALIHGDGEYATGEESAGSGGVDIPAIASASGEVSLEVLNKRKVSGFIAAVVTITDRSASQPIGPLGVAKDAGITEATIGDTTRRIYDGEKISTVRRDGSWVFVAGPPGPDESVLTENEFVERYREITGSDELEDVDTRRNWGKTILWGTLMAGGFAVVGVGAATDDDGDAAVVYMPVGVSIAVGFGIPFVVNLAMPDGSPTDHHLLERDAHLYVHRYNRALLRRTVRDVQRVDRESALPPPERERSIGFGVTGVHGTF